MRIPAIAEILMKLWFYLNGPTVSGPTSGNPIRGCGAIDLDN